MRIRAEFEIEAGPRWRDAGCLWVYDQGHVVGFVSVAALQPGTVEMLESFVPTDEEREAARDVMREWKARREIEGAA